MNSSTESDTVDGVGPSPEGRRTVRRPDGFDAEASLTQLENSIQVLETRYVQGETRLEEPIARMRAQLAALTQRTFAHLTGWQVVQMARHPSRPLLADYLDLLVPDFCELHGDRRFGDDPALVCGWARLAGHRVMLIGNAKGRTVEERVRRRFGYAQPEGYRKALRAMKLAEKFGVPVVTLIDTPGAYPDVESEQRGIAEAIAVNLREMARLRTPVVAVVIGEGGSGGALGIGVGDRLAMMRYAYYSVITPEGCAAILFGDSQRAARAADALHLTVDELKRLGLIDDLVDEPAGGAHRDPAAAARMLEAYLREVLAEVKSLSGRDLLQRRRERWRRMGTEYVRAADVQPGGGR